MADEAVFPIRYPTDTSGISKGVTELERLRSALQEDQKAIAGFQKAIASLKLDPDVQAYQRMQAELKKAGIEADRAGEKLKAMQAERAKMVSAGADAKKLTSLDAQIAKTQATFDNNTSAVERLKKGISSIDTKPAVMQFKDANTALKDAEQSAAANQSRYLALGGDITKMGDKVKSGFDKFAEGADQAGLGIGGMKQKFEALKALGPAGVVAAIVITVVALGVALAKTTYDLAKFALEAGDAARSTSILMEAATGSQAGAKEMGAMVRRLRNDFAGSREEIAGMALELRRSGLQGVHLERTLRTVGIVTKTMGEAAGGILKGLVDRGAMSNRFVLNPFDLRGTGVKYNDVAQQLAKMTGRTIATVKGALQNGQVKLADGIQALEAAVKLRLGDLAKRQLLALPTQVERARENLRDIFSGVDPTKFLIGLSSILELLDETTATGKTLRSLAKTIFQPLLDNASAVFPIVRAFLLGMVFAIIELTIVAVKAYIWFKKTFGDSSLFKGIDGAKLAFYAGAAAVGLLIVGVIALIAVFAALATMVAIATAPIWAIPAAVGAAIAAAIALKAKITEALSPSKGATDANKAITDGVVNGIKDGTPAVDAAMRDMAKSGVKAFESELQIASPSKELRASAKWIGPGVALGIDDGQEVVSQAMSRLVEPSEAMPNGAAKAPSNGAGWSFQNMFGPGSIIVNATDGKIDGNSVMQQLVELLENARAQGSLVPQGGQ